MSHYLYLNFIENVENCDVLQKINEIKNAMIDNYKSIIDENFVYRPSHHSLDELKYTTYRDYRKDTLNYERNNNWLVKLFELKIIYYPKLKILAFNRNDFNFSKKYPYVQFQNSTDQDYSLEDYHGLKLAEPIFNKYHNMSVEEIKNICEYFDDETELEYVKRSLAYKEIEEKLDISKYLYEKKNFENEDHQSLVVIPYPTTYVYYYEFEKYFNELMTKMINETIKEKYE